MADLPRGTVTFLFTDVEASTRLWERDRTAMRAAVERQITVLRDAAAAHRGLLYKSVGDGTQMAFPAAPNALHAAIEAQRALLAEPWPDPPGPLSVRMALHVGEAEPDARGDYLAAPLNRLARLLSAGHGGQVLLTQAVQQLVRDDLPGSSTLDDLGAHRLRDLLESERVFQLRHPGLLAEFPPLRTLNAHPNNLPRQPTPFLGRRDEFATIVTRLRGADAQLLTLIGPGGVGKSRLAVHAAAELLEDFPDGVFLVELAPLSDPAMVPSAVAAALSLREHGAQALQDTIVEFLENKRLLLVLDNCEHLLESAPVISELLRQCSNLKVLATSRAPLQLRAEYEYPIGPMVLPNPSASSPAISLNLLADNDAIMLFVDRAQSVRPNFTLTSQNAATIAAICRRLDGLPLAIELAAARIRLLSLEELLSRLTQRLPMLTGGSRDVQAHQQTMQETIDWSYHFLEPPAQMLFARVGMFAGGATVSMVEAVCSDQGGHLAGVAVLDGLESLAQQSLVTKTESEPGVPRIRMLETIREYALMRLAEHGETERLARRHADFFLALAQDLEPMLEGSDQADVLNRLEREHDNVRVALTWLVSNDAERSLRLTAALWWFWWVRGHLREGRDWLERTLSVNPTVETSWRAQALTGVGTIAESQGDYPAAASWHEEALALSRANNDKRSTAKSLESLGDLALSQGDIDRAVNLFEEALELSRALGDQKGIAHAYLHLGTVAYYQQDRDRATALYRDALDLLRNLGNTRGVAAALTHLGVLEAVAGSKLQGVRHLREAEALWGQLEDKHGKALVQGNLGEIMRQLGKFDVAAEYLSHALNQFRELENKEGIGTTLTSLGHLEMGRGNHAESAPHLREALEIWNTIEDLDGLARSLDALAGLAVRKNHAQRAAMLRGAADAMRQQNGTPLSWSDHEVVQATEVSARDALGDAQFSASRQAGQQLDRRQIIEHAMKVAAQP